MVIVNDIDHLFVRVVPSPNVKSTDGVPSRSIISRTPQSAATLKVDVKFDMSPEHPLQLPSSRLISSSPTFNHASCSQVPHPSRPRWGSLRRMSRRMPASRKPRSRIAYPYRVGTGLRKHALSIKTVYGNRGRAGKSLSPFLLLNEKLTIS